MSLIPRYHIISVAIIVQDVDSLFDIVDPLYVTLEPLVVIGVIIIRPKTEDSGSKVKITVNVGRLVDYGLLEPLYLTDLELVSAASPSSTSDPSFSFFLYEVKETLFFFDQSAMIRHPNPETYVMFRRVLVQMG